MSYTDDEIESNREEDLFGAKYSSGAIVRFDPKLDWDDWVIGLLILVSLSIGVYLTLLLMRQ
jgi:hypothetical protein